MKLEIDSPAEEVRIEIIPLIDVIFCILTFFILAAVGLTRQQAINLDLPAADTGSPLPTEGSSQVNSRLYVSIDAIGQVYIDRQPVSLDLLYDVLLQHQRLSPSGLIVLYASKDSRYEDVVQVLDLLRSVGGNRVALATLPSAFNQSLEEALIEETPDNLLQENLQFPLNDAIPPSSPVPSEEPSNLTPNPLP
ncbi:MAG: biopolymer transporter ExbD [Pseudanabaenales cyanobacterium]|nr:biopolymer transporter ExbD [Pseudanabaenales cyanobacterium]